jgi:hypothetical protein
VKPQSPASQRWCLPRGWSSPTIHLPYPFKHQWWMMRRQGKFSGSWWSTEVTGVGRGVTFVT